MEMNRLMIDLMPYGFDNEPIKYEVMRGSIESIDFFTYKYKNEDVWFEAMKEKILTEIKRKRTQNGQFLPNDIELLRVYILKEELKEMRVPVLQSYEFLNVSVWETEKIETEKRPLFKEIKVHHQFVLLEKVIKNRMFKGNLEMFYRLVYELGDEVGFFKEVPESLQQNILTALDERIIHEVYSYLASHGRFMALVRLLLLDHPTFEEMKKEYQRLFGDFQENVVEGSHRLERIRMPYKDKDE